MKKSAYGKPVLLSRNQSQTINKVENIDEISIQNIVFGFPDCIPVSDIDEAYNPLVPVCKELNTPVGPLDILMVTPNGDLSIIETKLWRNPDARRKVVAQILDYANELSKWTYEDLQREINKKLGVKGNTLYEIVCKTDSDLIISEADFVDAVNRNLARGKFLLLIIGDGIKEGASSITEFLTNSGHLNFAFGMIELTIFQINEFDRLVIPRTIVKTTEIQKINIELPDGLVISNVVGSGNSMQKEEGVISPDLHVRREFFSKFWEEFISELEFDDPGQDLPKPTMYQNIFVYPGLKKNAWVSAFFSQSLGCVGVYFRCRNDQSGLRLAEQLRLYHDDIRKELGEDLIWSWDANIIDGFGVRLPLNDVYSSEHRERIKEFFASWMNKMVNALRPRMKEIQ